MSPSTYVFSCCLPFSPSESQQENEGKHFTCYKFMKYENECCDEFFLMHFGVSLFDSSAF